jgi:hypothetical protein
MKFKQRTLEEIANMICGNADHDEGKSFIYRSSSYITRFFQDCDLDFRHDGSTRYAWVTARLEEILSQPQPAPNVPPDAFSRVIRTLMDPADAVKEGSERTAALTALNKSLSREGFEAFYAPDKQCYLRHIGTNTIATVLANPHRPFSEAEVKKKGQLAAFLFSASEDELIEEVLLPMFRQMGFHRITAAGHRDKALEYGKDIWMRYTLPTQHVLYFGIQVKKGKLDAAGTGKNTNMAEIHNQTLMMLGHEIFDPEIGKRVLVDHAFIVAGGEITKAARNWLGNILDASKRSQVMFMDRDDILNLFVVNNIPLPAAALDPEPDDEDAIPF